MARRRLVKDRWELDPMPLARGGMGEVWLGRDVRLDREVAVKFIRYPDGEPDKELVRRFVRESRITARLEHPGVPAVFDVGTAEDGRPFIVMQRVHGISVADLVSEQGALPLGWAVAIAAQVSSVLSIAHQASLVHRDLKPGNLMLCHDGTVKVLDFGLAVALGVGKLSRITHSGESLGTPNYMAPEQVLASRSEPQTDLYALGCTLYEMLAGRPVFSGDTAYAVMSKQVQAPAPDVRRRRPDVPDGLSSLVRQLLEKRPEDRPGSADEVYQRLMPNLTDVGPIPGVLDGASAPSQVRMYAGVVARVLSHREHETIDAGAAEGRRPAPIDEPSLMSRADLRRARSKASSLARRSLYSQAAEVLVEVVEPASKILGSTDTDVVELRHDLANILFDGGDFRQAEPLYRQLATDLARRDDADPDFVFRCRLQRATCLALTGDSRQALGLLNELLAAERDAYGDDDPRTLELRQQIGLLQLGAGMHETAAATLDELLSDLVHVHGDSHPSTVKVRELLEGLRDARRDVG